MLSAQGLVKHFPVGHRGLFGRPAAYVQAVTDVDIQVARGETLGLVGESGCGKSTLARVLGLLYPADRGRIRFAGQDIARTNVRGFRRAVQMVFQDPFSSLNPRLPVSAILAEPLNVHRVGTNTERRDRCAELMNAVGLDPSLLDRYPHEFSGGQRQRIAIGRALALKPELVIADEPLSALDVSVQSQILNLLMELKEQMELAYLFISHDLAVVDHIADRVAVMYLGRIVESAPRDALFSAPAHPYTRTLIAAVPTIGDGKRRLKVPIGDVPSPLDPPPGCPYHPRCAKAQSICREVVPLLEPAPERSPAHSAACHFPEPGLK